MSNLLEKGLLTGFGIFLLVSFLSLIAPFLGILSDFNKNQKDDLYDYINFINEFDSAVKQVINYPELQYLEEIEYPLNFNITLENHYAKFYFLLEDIIQVRILEFAEFFHPVLFYDMLAKTYLLSISMDLNLINVSFV
jgi:hypothetical protein